MSVRAIKKKENQSRRPFKKQQFNQRYISNNQTNLTARSNSHPNLTISHKDTSLANCIHSKSETELSLSNRCPVTNQTSTNLINAKSEICLKSVSVHKTMEAERLRDSERTTNSPNQLRRMSERSTVSTSLYTSTSELQNRGFADTSNIRIPIIGYEVMEERARFTAGYHRLDLMLQTLQCKDLLEESSSPSQSHIMNAFLYSPAFFKSAPILLYVYKLRVENPFRNDCWLVLRRYTDFVRLNNKLKTMIPNLNLTLPRKKIFGDNFGSMFLDNRVQGLQMFVNSIMGNDRLKHLQVVKEFFCLDEPPTYSESMEECRAIFEAQEETITHLKIQLRSKEQSIESLEQKLRLAEQEKEALEKAMRNSLENCSKCSKEINNILHETHGDSNKKSELPIKINKI